MQDHPHPLFRTMAALGAAGAVILLAGFGVFLYYQPIDQQATHAAARITGVYRYNPVSGKTAGAKSARFANTDVPAAVVDWGTLPPEMVVAAHWYDANGVVEGGVGPAAAAGQPAGPIPIEAASGAVAGAATSSWSSATRGAAGGGAGPRGDQGGRLRVIQAVGDPPVAANPQHHHHPGYRMGAAITIGILVAMFIGSILGVFIRSPIALLDLGGLIVIGIFFCGTYLLVAAFSLHDRDRRHRRLRIVAIVFGVGLVVWMFVIAGIIANLNLLGAIVALPFTVFAIWVLRHLNRNQKEPWRLFLAAFGWGGVVAVNLALLLEVPYDRLFVSNLIPGPGQGISTSFSAATFEELPKGLAVLLLFLVMRSQFDDVVDGILYGAMVGLGFNFVETLGYMSAHGLVAQLYVRQILGLFTGHTTYTALIGAGIGIARQQPGTWRRLVAILSGFLLAISAHFMWDALALTAVFPRTDNVLLEAFVFLPLKVLLIDGPFTLIVILLLVAGWRREGRMLREQLTAEAALGMGTVLPEEVDVLASPRQRARWRRREFMTYGWRGYRWLGRLQRAQLALAMERWHRARQEIDDPLEAEDALRQKILIVREGGR